MHKLTICVNVEPGYETFVRERTPVETEDGRDPRTYTSSGLVPDGCTRVSLVYRDRLRYEGWYYGGAHRLRGHRRGSLYALATLQELLMTRRFAPRC